MLPLRLALSFVLVLCLVGCKGGQRAASPALPPQTLLGGELGLDHVGVAVHDLQAAEQTFHGLLGFDRPVPGRLPNGIDNVNYYFEDATYLETLTYYDRGKAGWLAWFIDHYTEGGNFVVLSIRSVDGTAAFLRQRGMATGAPAEGRIEVQGMSGGTWRTLFFDRSPLPGSPLYFIEYPRADREAFLGKLADPRTRATFFSHRNTAVGIRAVWMAVRDLEAATRAYTSIGLAAEGAFQSERLDARGQSIGAGRGHIILWSPRGGGGPVKAFLDRRPPGVLGMAIEVKSLDTARRVIGQGTGTSYEAYAGPLGRSILVPPQDAHGAWIEFFEVDPRPGGPR